MKASAPGARAGARGPGAARVARRQAQHAVPPRPRPSGVAAMMLAMAGPAPSGGAYGDPTIWALEPGEAIERTILHERYGGRVQGGIVPSRSSPNIMIFPDQLAPDAPGSVDGWRADGCFHYTGEGLQGDQLMKAGNASILGHASDGRALRLFRGTRGQIVYEGQFVLDADTPFYTTDACEARGGAVRSVIVFRLRPLDINSRPSASKLDPAIQARIEDVPVEQRWTEKTFVAPGQKADVSERRQQELVLAFREHLLGKGHEVVRLKIVPDGEAKPLFADLLDRTANTLFAAKGTVERGSIRMAVGQLLDYRRFVEPAPRLAVLLPSLPRADLRDYLQSAGIELVWREGKRFE